MVHICWDCGCHPQRNWGARKHLEKGGVGLYQALTQIVLGLAGKLECVKSQVLVKDGRQLLCEELSAVAGMPCGRFQCGCPVAE